MFLHDGLYHSERVSELEIIDGQQRLTTVSLIYAVLYRRAVELGKEQKAAEILLTYLTNQFTEDGKEKLVLPQSNAPVYAQILNGTLPANAPAYSRLRENFEHIIQRIPAIDLDPVLAGLERLAFVEISLEREKDNPQRIFESLNSTGLELSQADLIRNYVLMGVSRAEQERLFVEYWEPIERYARDIQRNKNLVSEFVRDYLTLVTRRIPKKAGVYEAFKGFLDQGTHGDTLKILGELRTFAEYYGRLVNPSLELNPNLRREMESLKVL